MNEDRNEQVSSAADRKQLIILGSGPAGLSAAIYASRAELDTLVIEKEPMSGGQVLNTYEVDNYPGLPGINGFDLGMKFRDHADKLGAEFVSDEIVQITAADDGYFLRGTHSSYEAQALIVATGAAHRLLDVPGESRLAGHGVSYCATCDGAFFRGQDVVVAGGGDVAAEDAIFLARMCRHVYMVHRRHELRAARSIQSRLFALDNVEMVWDSVSDEVTGDDKVDGLIVSNVKTGEKRRLDVSGVFVAVGILPNSALVKDLVDTDSGGYIQAGEDGITSRPGIFAAGDVRSKPLRQIVTSAADGANCVTSAERYLSSRG